MARQNLRITHPLGKCYTQISLDLHKNNLLPTAQISLQIKSLQIYFSHIDPYTIFDYKLLLETKQSMSFIKDIKDVGNFLPSLICNTHFCRYKQNFLMGDRYLNMKTSQIVMKPRCTFKTFLSIPYSYLISRDFNFAIFAIEKKSRN